MDLDTHTSLFLTDPTLSHILHVTFNSQAGKNHGIVLFLCSLNCRSTLLECFLNEKIRDSFLMTKFFKNLIKKLFILKQV